jgi:type II secretory pathway pseudopilin PulG
MRQQGFSLVELLITMALLIGAAYKGMEFLESQKREILSQHQELEINSITQDIQTLLRNPASCRATFEGQLPTLSENRVNEITQVNQIRNNRLLAQRYRVSHDLNQSYGPSKVMIKSYSLVEPKIEDGFTHLRIVFDQSQIHSSPTPKLREERIPLYFELDEQGRIVHCSLNPNSRIEQFWNLTSTNALGFTLGRVGIMTNAPQVQLDLGGKLKLLPSELQNAHCREQNSGLIRFDQASKTLALCNGRQWVRY